MKYFVLLLSVAFLATGIAAVNGKHVSEQQHGRTSSVSVSAIKPTEAPLMTSTTAPAKVSEVHVSATAKSVTKNSVTKATVTTPSTDKEMKMGVLPIKSPAMVEYPLQAEESTSLAVTGFITQNGSIYEIEDKNGNGIGKIESRQANDDDQHICNYGAVVIYSDVPCDRLSNVKIREYEDKPALDQAPASVVQQENKPAAANDNDESEDREDLDKRRKAAKRRASNKRRNNNNKNKKTKLQQQKGNKKRPNKNALNRPKNTNNNKNNRRRLQQNRRQQQNRRRQQQNHQQDNRRPWEVVEVYDDDDDDDEDEYDRGQFENQRIRKVPRRQQAQRYTTDYDADDY